MPSVDQPETLLLRQPTVSAQHVVFLYASDLWIAGRGGENPRRLTAHKGVKSTPLFSPDGQWVAFSGNYDGNTSVYVISSAGGSPRRLTYHPGSDWVRGWTPDGQRVLFATSRDTYHQGRYNRLYTVALEGDYPDAMPMPIAERGSFGPDGSRIAYTTCPEAFWSWKRYRGGRTVRIWILDLASYEYVEIPHQDASDTFPCWVDDTVYFLSDRDGTMNVYAYGVPSGEVRRLTDHQDWDVRSLTAGNGVLAYEQGGRVHLYDLAADTHQALHISIAADLPHVRPHYEKAVSYIQNAGISASGARVVFEARGEILTVPAEKGDVRNLTRTPGVHERYPAWSSDGQRIAYLSDASGEYELVLSDQMGEVKTEIPLGHKTHYYSPIWSPSSDKILYTDKALNLYYINLEDRVPIHVDTDTYDHPERSLNPDWSPDGKWIAYTKRLETHLRAVYLYELATGESHQVTDGMSDATYACFSRDGKYLFFAASANYGLNTGWLDMSSYERPATSSLYLVVLGAGEPSPLAAESDEEKTPQEKEEEKGDDKDKDKEEEKKVEVHVDLEGIDQRIVALPLPPQEYRSLQAGKDKLFYLEATPRQLGAHGPALHTLYAFDMKERKSEAYLRNLRAYWLSADGTKLLYQGEKSDTYGVIDATKKPEDNPSSLKLGGVEVYVDPRAEWRQMFDEMYRIQRDFFYDSHMHGVDWEAARERYRPFLDHLGHRDDLNYLFAEMMGELVVGHAYVSGGDIPAPDRVACGLLGADYTISDGHYRIERIYPGLNWHPELRAPLTEPGVNVTEGEYILAVNGEPLTSDDNIYRLFEKTADQVTSLLVGPSTDRKRARTVTVKPLKSEAALRHWSWVEANRKRVDALSQGRVAYVYMANTSVEGYASFNRYYYAQLDKDAVVLDERFNGGGSVADYVIDMLDRPLLCHWATRQGEIFHSPNASIFGPKAMIINEFAGSGGDAMPLFFRRRGMGKLVGKRTWGGLVGIYDYPPLIDGGRVTAPRMAIFSPDDEWEVENVGVPPDVEVEMTPKFAIEGRDPQLEKAVEIVLEALDHNPPPRAHRPPPADKAG
ncbi:MAG: PDZ domain-containing protein [Anaerolineae bacterium]